ncbi:MAG: thioredoxin [Clostridia bacterium]|nr:thioredoxin [Clostridia bacterium]
MLKITSDNFQTEVEESKTLVVIDLYADWCGPCRMLAPIFEQVAGEYADVKFAKLNVDDEPKLAIAFKAQSIPMLAFVKDGVFCDVSVGLITADKLRSLVDKNK